MITIYDYLYNFDIDTINKIISKVLSMNFDIRQNIINLTYDNNRLFIYKEIYLHTVLLIYNFNIGDYFKLYMFDKTNKLVFFYNFISDISVFYSIDIRIMYRYKNIYKYKNTNSYLINTQTSSGFLGFDKYYFNYRLKYKDLVYDYRFYYYYKYYNIYIKKTCSKI